MHPPRFPAFLSLGCVLFATLGAVAQLPRPSIECNCSRTGPYVAPGRAPVAWNALASPRGTYTVEPYTGRLGLTVKHRQNEILNTGPYGQEISWGFSPDEHRLVIHTTRAGPPGVPAQHFAWLHDLTHPHQTPWDFTAAVREAVALFSPHGRYFLHAAIDPHQRTHLSLVDALTLQPVGDPWSFSATPGPGDEGDRLGLAGWGFSPDDADASFIYGYNRDGGASLNLLNLPRGRRVIAEWAMGTAADWRFSPCGDLLAVIFRPIGSNPEVWLEQTVDGSHRVAGYSVPGCNGLEALADTHVAHGSGGLTRLTDNLASAACEGIPQVPPYWPAHAKLNASLLRPTSLQLTRPTARSDGGPIVLYEIRTESPADQVVATLLANDPPDVTLHDLLPNTEYTFAIRAMNLAELWTADAVRTTVTTPQPDEAPAWPLRAALQAADRTETSARLTWPAAVDDHAVTHYRLYRDQELIATLDGTVRSHTVSGLVIGRSYRFQVQAGDALDQWSTDGPTLRIATEDLTPPTWPTPALLHARDRGLTRLTLEWSPASDNVGVYLYRLFLFRHGESFLYREIDGASTNTTLACLLPNSTFAFRIEAGDEAGNWTTNGPHASVSTRAGSDPCLQTLDVLSVNSREELARGTPDPAEVEDPWFNAESEHPAISADGRFVAFDSIAINLVPNDHNNTRITIHQTETSYFGTQVWFSDIFVRDRLAGTTERVSVSSSGTPVAIPGSSVDATISANGQCVAFTSNAPDLVPSDPNDHWDVFLRDRESRTTHLLSRPTSGTPANGNSSAPTLSADATSVAFVSEADNLVANDTNQVADVFLLDRRSRDLTCVSVASDGTRANGRSWLPAISSDGRFVAFGSDASNLVANDTNNRSDVFVHDRETGETTRVSVASDGTQANHSSARTDPSQARYTQPALSANGRFVAFDSYASNLVPDDTNQDPDVFVHDRETGETTRVSVSSTGAQAETPVYTPGQGYAASYRPSLSGDGRFVVFTSKATSLVPEKKSITTDIFLHDRQTGETRRLSVCPCDEAGPLEPDIGSDHPAISADGRVIVFHSEATNLKPGLIDPNWSSDIFSYTHDPGPIDSDGDGTPDAEEQGPDGTDPLYDGDGDGVPDRLQPNTTVRHTQDRQHYFRARASGTDAALRILPQPLPSPATLPPGVTLPFGIFQIEAWSAVPPGGPLSLEFTFPPDVPLNSFYKFTRLPDDPTPRWYEFMFDGQTGAEIETNVVRLHFVDGQRGDADLLADGNLLDPGGPAWVGSTAAPRLECSLDHLDLGPAQAQAEFGLENTGGRSLVWAAQNDLPTWLTLQPVQGTLDPGRVQTVTLRVRRQDLPAGPLAHTVVLRSGGGSRALHVTAEVPFALENKARWVGPCLVLEWRSEPGTLYRVQTSPTLDPPAWRDASEWIHATSPITSWTDCPASPQRGFYRILHLPPSGVRP